MKYSIFLFILLSISNLSATENDTVSFQNIDTCLVIQNDNRIVNIKQGQSIVIRIGDQKFRGPLKVMSDSTIKISSQEFMISDIDMIAVTDKTKTIALILLDLPFIGIGALFSVGITWGNVGMLLGGMAIIAASITVGVIENRFGKRFRANKRTKINQELKIRKYTYSIKTS